MNVDTRLADRPVFVTGADGFVGSHLTDQLVEAGADVHVLFEQPPVESSRTSDIEQKRSRFTEVTYVTPIR